jgi:hypothetical protein
MQNPFFRTKNETFHQDVYRDCRAKITLFLYILTFQGKIFDLSQKKKKKKKKKKKN